jgi:hypothetical protein
LALAELSGAAVAGSPAPSPAALENSCWSKATKMPDGSVRYGDRLCFPSGGVMTSTDMGITESIESGGSYRLDGARIEFVSDGGEGWMWTPAVDGGSFSCAIGVANGRLTLSGCTGGIPDTVLTEAGDYRW